MSQNRPAEGPDVMARALELMRSGDSFALATVVWRQPPSSGQHGSRAIIMDDGSLYGWIGGACAEPVIIREAKKVLEKGESALIWLGQEKDLEAMHVPDGVMTVPMSCQSEGALQIFIEPVAALPHVLVVGRSPMAMTLVDLVRDVGWRADLVDGPDFVSTMITPSTAVVIATQGHGDEEAVTEALRAEPTMVGLVASRKRGQVVRGFLADMGVPSQKLEQVHVPIGLDLGHTSHREIAVSILAELVQMRAAGALKARTRMMLPMIEPDEVIDLVCGMTVEAVPANRPFEYEGTTYYFCAMGCRKAFEKDPASFISREVTC
jgi:xanthine dehydrogenase accessory factor